MRDQSFSLNNKIGLPARGQELTGHQAKLIFLADNRHVQLTQHGLCRSVVAIFLPRLTKGFEMEFRGWLKVKEAAKYCGLSERKIRSLLKEGLRHSRLRSGTILIKIEWINEYLERFEAQENDVDRIVDEVVKGF